MADSLLTAYWIKTFATLGLLIALLVLLVRNKNKGTPYGGGSSSLETKVKKLGAEYTLFSGVVVPALRGMSRIDHVIVSPYGIFVLTMVNESGKVSGRIRDAEWEIKSARQRDVLYNPLWENRKWINALEDHLGPQPFIPVVVFTRAKLKNDFGKNVISLSHLPGHIKKHDKPRLFSDKLGKVLQTLKSTNPENL